MGYAHDHDDDGIVIDFVQDAIHTVSNPVLVVARKFLGSWESWVDGESLDLRDELLAVLLRNNLKLLCGRSFDQNAISGHGASCPE